MQNYLVIEPVSKYFKAVAVTNKVTTWKSKRLSAENINVSLTSVNFLYPGLNYIDNAKTLAKLNGSCLKQENLHSQIKRWWVFILSTIWISGHMQSLG